MRPLGSARLDLEACKEEAWPKGEGVVLAHSYYVALTVTGGETGVHPVGLAHLALHTCWGVE